MVECPIESICILQVHISDALDYLISTVKATRRKEFEAVVETKLDLVTTNLAS